MKKLGMTLALAVMLALPAAARVRFGVSIGGPVYYGPPVYSSCGPYGCYPAYYGRYYYGPSYRYGYYRNGHYHHYRYYR